MLKVIVEQSFRQVDREFPTFEDMGDGGKQEKDPYSVSQLHRVANLPIFSWHTGIFFHSFP